MAEIKERSTPLVSLPTYTLIDPKGRIVTRNFLRPSKPEFETQLRAILKN